MWHKVERQTDEMGLKAELTTFVPYTQDKVELTKVTITNTQIQHRRLHQQLQFQCMHVLHQILETTGM